MEERLKIIDSFKSLFGKREKGIEKRIQFLKFSISFTLILTIITVGVVIGSIIFDLVDLKMLAWSKMGLLVLLSLPSILRFPNGIYELKLLNHSKKMANGNGQVIIKEANLELMELIENLNTIKYKWILIVLTGVIGISSL